MSSPDFREWCSEELIDEFERLVFRSALASREIGMAADLRAVAAKTEILTRLRRDPNRDDYGG